MKRITCTLIAFALVMWTFSPAQGHAKGEIRRDLPYTLEVDNTSAAPAHVEVYYLGREIELIEVITVEGNMLNAVYPFPRPGRGVSRIIFEADPGVGCRITVRVNQLGKVATSDDMLGEGRLSFNAVGP